MPKNKTICRKRIGRKVQPKQFESLDISCEYEDTIEWDNMEERQAGIDKMTALAIEDFDRSCQTICESLGIESKSISVTHTTGDGVTKSGTAVSDLEDKKTVSPAADLDDWFDEV